MKTLNFSQNWNGKLDLPYFTTIRLSKPSSYRVGDKITFSVGRSKQSRRILGVGDIVDVKHCLLSDLTDDICLNDTGYGRAATVALIQTMYKNIVFDWNKQLLVIYSVKVTGRLPNSQRDLFM